MIRSLVVASVVTVLIAPAVWPVPAAAQAAPAEWDGLVQRPSRAVDLLYVRPGASLEGFKAVRIAPLQVSFDQNWNPNRGRAGPRLTAADFQRIKDTLAREFARVSASELARSGYAVVQRSGEDVLDVEPFIVNLFITAPGTRTAGRTRTYTANPGRMTLVAELRDSETHTILARVVDRRNAPSTGMFQLTTSGTNLGAARQIIQRWASALRTALDAANGRS